MSKRVKPDTQRILEIAHGWILKLEDPHVTQETREHFVEWLNASARNRDIYDQAITFREAFVSLADDDFDGDNHMPTIAERLTAFTDSLSTAFSETRFRIAAGAVAAVAAALVIAPQILAPNRATAPLSDPVSESYQTEIGQTESFTLADGTEMTLGAASLARSVYSEDKRIVELIAGAVFVDVERDETRPFSVKSGNLTATALGTAFDVRQGSNIHRVAVAEGQVEVSFPIILNEAPSGLLSREKLDTGQAVAAAEAEGMRSVTNVNVEDIGSWRKDQLVYKGATLDEVFADANRYSAMPIIIAPGSEAVGQLQLRGVFQGTDIDRLLSTVTLIHDVEIDRSNDTQIVVRKKAQQ
ncbi:FecR family protein [Eilatimonas milleporae]|uniref:FecR family protein n=1 Tax=Eilatimonas milleporae TaxID=911205 RepID=A0A3M0C6T3_9PROT|nr:FecR domain-containing protein [Eilatimonas milleporae]RMB04942.1 FecR family protein [Eilatimonas milleporae]